MKRKPRNITWLGNNWKTLTIKSLTVAMAVTGIKSCAAPEEGVTFFDESPFAYKNSVISAWTLWPPLILAIALGLIDLKVNPKKISDQVPQIFAALLIGTLLGMATSYIFDALAKPHWLPYVKSKWEEPVRAQIKAYEESMIDPKSTDEKLSAVATHLKTYCILFDLQSPEDCRALSASELVRIHKEFYRMP